MKLLAGSELADYIKQRHLQQVRRLRAQKIFPVLAIVQTKNDPVIDTYVRLKKRYGEDIGVEVRVSNIAQSEAPKVIDDLNKDDSVRGIIVQLPLENPSQTEEVVNLIAPGKDVDALGQKAQFEPATPNAILWLLAGHNVNLAGKKILIIGKGRLVGAPLEKIFKKSNLNVTVIDGPTDRLARITREADIIITAANAPNILSASMIKPGTVVVDAGVAGEGLKGNLTSDVYERDDLTLTPKKGGVGPLTVCSLFENLLRASELYGKK